MPRATLGSIHRRAVIWLAFASAIVLVLPSTALAYNRTNAVSYADNYALGSNTGPPRNYYLFGDDCTNFVSQVLYAGGLAQIGLGNQGDANWWWDPVYRAYSLSWTTADHLNLHVADYQGTRFDYSNMGSLQNGDFILMDLKNVHKPTHARVYVGWGTELSDGNFTWAQLEDQHSNNEYHQVWYFGADRNAPIWWFVHVR
ncbi:MAG TPA: amidase domain-containing protein [Thermomicrobiaceae bacterium]|nr:amidase domain-containing protein [Thermomicrobiaceae bacterium]